MKWNTRDREPRYPAQMPVLERPAPPFDPGDTVEMTQDGFSTFHLGDQGVVEKLHWGNTVDEWCIMVRHLAPPGGNRVNAQGYRASRFKLIKKGVDMRPVYAIFEMTTEGGTLPPTIVANSVQLFEGNSMETAEAVKGLLKVNPDKLYAYGRVDTMAKVDAPPVTFTKL